MKLKNHYDTTSLSFCKTEEDVDKALEIITDNSSDFALKTRLLYYHMGITQTFDCGPNEERMAPEWEYALARHHLLRINKSN